MGKDKILEPYIFCRLKADKQPKTSVFVRIRMGETSSSSPSLQERDLVFSHLGKINKVQSSIPSHIKRVSTLDAKMDDLLKAKRRTLVLTGHEANTISK